MLRARRIGSAWPLARTRTAWSRGAAPAGDPPTDLGGDPVRLVRPRREDLEPDRRRGDAARRVARSRLTIPVRTSRRSGSLNRISRYAASRMGALRAVVPPEDDRPCPDVAVLEGEDVVDGGAAEGVDRLVVVPDDRHVAVLVGQERRRARPARGSCPGTRPRAGTEAPGDRGPGRGGGPHEPQRQGDLVAEVDAAVLGHAVADTWRRRGPARADARPARAAARGIVGRSPHPRRRAAASATSRGLGRHSVGVGLVVRRD